MNTDKPEVSDAEEAEAIDEKALIEQAPFKEDGMDTVIAVAQKMEAYSKAMDTILNAIVKRSYAGDWVCHSRETDPEDKKKANIGAAAAERIATFLGIQERTWTAGTKEWSDDHKHYTYSYEADFGFKNRWVHAIGRAGTRDKFFGFAKGQWKPLEEVQEDHIRTAAFRACRKEGVRLLLGLRSIPIRKLTELGYDASKINYAGFEDKGRLLSDEEKKKTEGEAGTHIKNILPMRMEMTKGKSKTTGKDWQRWDVFDKEGVKYALFAGDESRRVKKLQDCVEQKTSVTIRFVIQKGSYGEAYQITTVEGVEEK